MRKLVSVLAVVGLLAASSCRESSTDVTMVTDAAGYSVGLINEGDEPRVTLRVATEPGTTQRVRIAVEQAQNLAAMGTSESIESTQTMDMTYTVTGVNDDIITVETIYDDMLIESVSADPASARAEAAINDAIIDAFVGATGTTDMTDRGAIAALRFPDLDLDLDIPGVSGPAMNDLMDQMFSSFEDNADSMAIPTPVEAVGVGASWSAVVEATMIGIPMHVDTTITLTDITDDVAIGELEQTIELVAGDIEMLGMTATIESGQMASSGTIAYQLDGGIMPLIDMDTDGTIRMTVMGTTLNQELSMKQTSTPL